MSNSLHGIAARYASALKASSVVAPTPGGDRPTSLDLWLWKLEETVTRLVEHGSLRKRPEGAYDHNWLYAHRTCLRTREDVHAAPDDVLLEALGLPPVEQWGWLHFMIRELPWYALLAGNWGLPSILGEYGGTNSATVRANEDELRATAALHFLEMMSSLGLDPRSQVQWLVDGVKRKYEGIHERPLSEDAVRDWLRRRNELVYYVYTCESVPFREGVKGPPAEVQYSGDIGRPSCGRSARRLRGGGGTGKRRTRQIAQRSSGPPCSKRG
jgi:hypothetical protein